MNNKIDAEIPYVKLRRTTITVTLRCTLRCKLCSADVINYDNPPHYSYDFIANEIEKYFEVVDYVEWLQFSGGEPFLNKDLPKMIEKAMQFSERFDKLMIFSNGTILPNEEMLEVMNKYKSKISFFLSNYGEISYNADKMISLWEKYGFSYNIKKYYGEDQHCGGWVDFGGWKKRNFSDEKLRQIYKKCGMHCMQFTVVQEGELHLCRMSYRGMELGAVARNTDEYLDLFDSSMASIEKKNKLIKMLSRDFIGACDHCNGDYGTDNNRVKPAEQLPNRSKL